MRLEVVLSIHRMQDVSGIAIIHFVCFVWVLMSDRLHTRWNYIFIEWWSRVLVSGSLIEAKLLLSRWLLLSVGLEYSSCLLRNQCVGFQEWVVQRSNEPLVLLIWKLERWSCLSLLLEWKESGCLIAIVCYSIVVILGLVGLRPSDLGL
jgi:hypothetical protein